MHARLAPDRYRAVEGVHEEALAAPDPAPKVDPARGRGRIEPALQQRPPGLLENHELVGEPLQAFQRRALRGVEDNVAPGELGAKLPQQLAAIALQRWRGVVHVASRPALGGSLRG